MPLPVPLDRGAGRNVTAIVDRILRSVVPDKPETMPGEPEEQRRERPSEVSAFQSAI